jgi:hypothetical protein
MQEVQSSASAAIKAMRKEAAADVQPPVMTDPKVAIMNLLKVTHL